MAATDVIVVDNSFTLLRHQDTQRIERVLEKWYKDLKANVVVSTEETTIVLFVGMPRIFTTLQCHCFAGEGGSFCSENLHFAHRKCIKANFSFEV